jgi:deazaflavin-dependent oxidoreductase (nitroreductase family)
MSDERIRPPWWLKYVNKVMIGAQHLGINFGPVVLTVPGRKSGKPRSTPVTPMTVDGKEYIVGGLPGSDWSANVRAAGECTLQRGRRTERVRLVEMSVEDARPLLRGSSRSRCRPESASSRAPVWSPDPIRTNSRRSQAAARCSGSIR